MTEEQKQQQEVEEQKPEQPQPEESKPEESENGALSESEAPDESKGDTKDSVNQIQADFMKRYLTPTGNGIRSVVQYLNKHLQSDQQRLFFATAMREAMREVSKTMRKNIIEELSKENPRSRKRIRDSVESLENQSRDFVSKIVKMAPREELTAEQGEAKESGAKEASV